LRRVPCLPLRGSCELRLILVKKASSPPTTLSRNCCAR
jgi:hypothetical protein